MPSRKYVLNKCHAPNSHVHLVTRSYGLSNVQKMVHLSNL